VTLPAASEAPEELAVVAVELDEVAVVVGQAVEVAEEVEYQAEWLAVSRRPGSGAVPVERDHYLGLAEDEGRHVRLQQQVRQLGDLPVVALADIEVEAESAGETD
jgi:hypothetical protein